MYGKEPEIQGHGRCCDFRLFMRTFIKAQQKTNRSTNAIFIHKNQSNQQKTSNERLHSISTQFLQKLRRSSHSAGRNKNFSNENTRADYVMFRNCENG